MVFYKSFITVRQYTFFSILEKCHHVSIEFRWFSLEILYFSRQKNTFS